MSLFSTFLLFLRTPRLAEKRSGRPGYLYRQSGIIRFSVFSAITIQPQLFDAKSLPEDQNSLRGLEKFDHVIDGGNTLTDFLQQDGSGGFFSRRHLRRRSSSGRPP